MKISLLCPSRQRPKKMFETLQSWIKKSAYQNEIILSIDSDDPTIDEYFELFQDINVIRVVSNNRSAVDAINRAAAVAQGDIFIVVSDDFDCPERWDEQILKAVEGKKDFIIKTFDGIQKWIITMPIMDRAYYNRFGYIYFDQYKHMFCDTEITCVADMLGRKIDLNILFPHNHYSIGKSVKDEVSDKADKTWNQGEALFIDRASKDFGLVNYPGKITNQEYLNWLRSKGVLVK